MQDLNLEFPILKTKVNGRPLIYLDSGATSLTPESVINKQNAYFHKYNANVHRGVATLSGQATMEFEQAREKVAQFINAEIKETIFTKGTTNSINQLTVMLEEILLPNSNIVVSIQEHHSNMIPWQQLARRKNIELRFVELDNKFGLDFDSLNSVVDENTAIVSLSHMSNVIGEKNDAKLITEVVKSKSKALVIFDGAQAVTHSKVDVKEIDCDFYCFSGHKLFGPTGIGILYGKQKLLEQLKPAEYGGEMMASVNRTELTFAELPHKFEAGTPNIVGAIALGAAIDFVNQHDIVKMDAYITKLTQYAVKRMQEVEGLVIYGSHDKKTSLITFNITGIHSHDLTTYLDEQGIQVRAGHHCNQLILKNLQTTSTTRASFQIYNSESDVDALVEKLKEAKEFFKMNDLESLYRQVIMEHSKEPKNKVDSLDHQCSCMLDNPSCGDKIELEISVNDDKISDIKYVNEGCTISMAAASIFSEMTLNKTIAETENLAINFNKMIDKEAYDENLNLGELVVLSGVSKYLARRKCAKIATDCFIKCVNENKIKGT